MSARGPALIFRRLKPHGRALGGPASRGSPGRDVQGDGEAEPGRVGGEAPARGRRCGRVEARERGGPVSRVRRDDLGLLVPGSRGRAPLAGGVGGAGQRGLRRGRVRRRALRRRRRAPRRASARRAQRAAGEGGRSDETERARPPLRVRGGGSRDLASNGHGAGAPGPRGGTLGRGGCAPRGCGAGCRGGETRDDENERRRRRAASRDGVARVLRG